MSEQVRPRIAILASGSGTTAEAFIHATMTDSVDAAVGLVISNNGNAGVFDKVDRLNNQYRGLGIDVLHISGVTNPDGKVAKGEQTLAESAAVCEAIQERDISLVALMGYMKRVNGKLLETFGHQDFPEGGYKSARIINTHPGPLPETRGLFGVHVQEEVLRLGLRNSAQTLHEVAAGYDTGPVIKYINVPVAENDTPDSLFNAVQQTEKMWLPWEIQHYLRITGLSDRRRNDEPR